MDAQQVYCGEEGAKSERTRSWIQVAKMGSHWRVAGIRCYGIRDRERSSDIHEGRGRASTPQCREEPIEVLCWRWWLMMIVTKNKEIPPANYPLCPTTCRSLPCCSVYFIYSCGILCIHLACILFYFYLLIYGCVSVFYVVLTYFIIQKVCD